ncbi:unnamed protein product [Cunninghamella echinulata]
MLPFHAIKLKKAIRDMRPITKESTPTTAETIKKINTTNLSLPTSTDIMKKDMSQDIIVSHATIYGKNTKRQLTNYEQAINQASVELALQDPSLLIQKGKLFDMAKKKLLEEGYSYKRGKSRSKLTIHSKLSRTTTKNTYPSSINSSLLKDNNNNNNNKSVITKKHQKRSDKAQKQSEKRLQLIQQLELELRQMRQIIKNKPINKSFSSQELHRREDLIKSKKRLSVEISKLKAQERKHQWYKRKCQHKANKFSMELDDDDELEDEENENENQENKNKKEKEKMIKHYPIQSTIHLPKSPPISPTHCSNTYLPPISSNPLSPSSSSVSLPSPSLSTSSLSTSPLASPTSHLLPVPSYFYLPPLISKQQQQYHHHHHHQHDHSLYSTSASNTPSIRESDVRGKALTVKDFCT